MNVKGFLSRKIGFGAAISLFVFLSALYLSLNTLSLDTIKDLGQIFLYVLIPLATEKLLGVNDLFNDLYEISTNNQMNAETKKELIRNSLELQVQEWNRLWNKLQCGDRKTWRKVIDLFKSFINGNMTLAEAVFVLFYFLYMAIIRNGLVAIGSPYDIIIQACSFLVVIIFTSKQSSIRVLSKIWKIVWSDATDWEHKIDKISHIIKMTTHQFYRIDIKQESEKSNVEGN